MNPGYYLFIASWLVFPAESVAQQYLVETLRYHQEPVSKVAFSPDGIYLASSSDDRTVCIYQPGSAGAPVQIRDFTRRPGGLAFHPRGNYLLAADGNQIKLFSLGGEYLNRFAGHATDIWHTDFDPEGRLLVSSSFDKTFRIWDFAGKNLLHNVEGHSRSVLAVHFSHSGRFIASGSLDQGIALWELPEITLMLRFHAHTGNIYSLDFSPDDRFLLSASRDKTICLHDLQEKKTVREFRGHDQAVFVARFLPDGIHFLSASFDGTAKLWSASSGECLHTFTGHRESINDLDISPNGSIFATASMDKTIRIWELDPKIFVDHYFPGRVVSELEKEGLGESRLTGETAADFRERQKNAEIRRSELYRELFVQYKEMIAGKSLRENSP